MSRLLVPGAFVVVLSAFAGPVSANDMFEEGLCPSAPLSKAELLEHFEPHTFQSRPIRADVEMQQRERTCDNVFGCSAWRDVSTEIQVSGSFSHTISVRGLSGHLQFGANFVQSEDSQQNPFAVMGGLVPRDEDAFSWHKVEFLSSAIARFLNNPQAREFIVKSAPRKVTALSWNANCAHGIVRYNIWEDDSHLQNGLHRQRELAIVVDYQY